MNKLSLCLLTLVSLTSACNRAATTAEKASQLYAGPFLAMSKGEGDCGHPVKVAEELFKMEAGERATVGTEITRYKGEEGFKTKLREEVRKLHESALATSYAKACPTEAVALGKVIRKSAEELGIDDLVTAWPEPPPASEPAAANAAGLGSASGVHRCVSRTGCIEYAGSGDRPEAMEKGCVAGGGAWAAQACSREGLLGTCAIDPGGSRAHTYFIYARPGDSDVGMRDVCEHPKDGGPTGIWTPAASSPPMPALAQADHAPRRATGKPTPQPAAPPKPTGPKPAAPPPPRGGTNPFE